MTPSALQRLSASSSHGALILAAALCVGAAGKARAEGLETPVAGPAASPAVHQVMAGETLAGIAATYGLDWRDLARANRISDPRRLPVGRVLTVAGTPSPADRRHRVRRGETLSGIARLYGVAWRDLARLNGLADPDRLAAGATLVIDPAAGGGAPPLHTAEARDRFALKYGVARLGAPNRTTPARAPVSLVRRLGDSRPAIGEDKIATAVAPPAAVRRPEPVARVLAEPEPARPAAARPGGGGGGDEVSPLSWEARAQADFAAQLSAFAARYDVNRARAGRRLN